MRRRPARPDPSNPSRKPWDRPPPDPNRPRAEWLTEARDKAMHRLSVREHSRVEIRNYLKRRKTPEDVVEEVIQSLVDRGYLSEDRFARSLIRDQAMRGKGPQYIRQKLQQKGVRKELKEIASTAEE